MSPQSSERKNLSQIQGSLNTKSTPQRKALITSLRERCSSWKELLIVKQGSEAALSQYTKRNQLRDFPGGPEVRTSLPLQECRFDPWSGS